MPDSNESAIDGLRLEAAAFGYGATLVVHDASFSVPQGQLLTLLGPSGCGKTTLLKLIGGYLAPNSGRIFIRGREVTHVPPEVRNAGMVFQHYALFPHLSAWGNVAFGLEARRVPRPERDRRVQQMLDRVGLTAAEHSRRPAGLSGGQQQRVALARALVTAPDVLLLDEPLANLDRHLRDQLRGELRTLQRETGVTAVMVTHDQEEALAVSDLVAVMSAGRLLQVGPAREVYDRPRTPFVARFLGSANLFAGKLVGETAPMAMLRPEHVVLNPAEGSCRWNWTGRTCAVTFLGAEWLVDVICGNGVSLRLRARAAAPPATGEDVTVGLPAEHLWAIPDGD